MKALVYHGPDQRNWDTFADAANTNALEVVLQASESRSASGEYVETGGGRRLTIPLGPAVRQHG